MHGDIRDSRDHRHPTTPIKGCNNRSGSCQAHKSPHRPPPWGATAILDPVRRPTPIILQRGAQQPTWVLPSTQQHPSPHTMERNSHPGSCQVHNSTHHPTTAWVQQPPWVPSRRATAPMTLHHGVQQPTWVLPGTQQPPLPHNCLDCSQAPNSSRHNTPRGATATQLPPPQHTTGCNNNLWSCQAQNGPCHGVQQAPWALPGALQHPPPYNCLSDTQQHPSPHTMRCNSHPGSCQAHNSTHHYTAHGATTALGPTRCTAPIAPHHGV